MSTIVAVARKDGNPGCEIHAVGCADIKKGKREVFGTFVSASDAMADYYQDSISEGSMEIEEAMADCLVLACAKGGSR
jgi:hypothetical protein